MIDIKELIKEKDFFIDSFKNKGHELNKEVNQVLNLYQEQLKLLQEEEELRHNLNQLTNQIKNTHDNNLKIKAGKISKKISSISNQQREKKKIMDDILLTFPNLPLSLVPIGEDENNNVVISTHLDQYINNNKKAHWDILAEKKLTLEQEASFISGKRHVIFSQKAALLIRALESFMIDEHIKAGYQFFDLPVMVNKETLINTSQLPKFKDDLFMIENGQYLLPTAEVPLTNLVAGKILKDEELPLKFCAFTQCFRNERVAAGKDARGIVRLYQFRKVELVKIGRKEDMEIDFNELLDQARSILEKLKLPYRLLELSTGDLGFGSKRTVDIEVWMPGQNSYREISSASIMGDFQSRRMKARKINSDKQKELVYTYNASGLAIERTLAAILENYLNEQGDIIIPEVLKKYLAFDKI